MDFPCARCGACCRFAGQVPELRALDRGDGVCRHLTAENLCAIYEARPPICRVAPQCPPALAMGEWYRRNADACERLHLRVYGRAIERM
jgi:Fe-S-cluster containining protein